MLIKRLFCVILAIALCITPIFETGYVQAAENEVTIENSILPIQMMKSSEGKYETEGNVEYVSVLQKDDCVLIDLEWVCNKLNLIVKKIENKKICIQKEKNIYTGFVLKVENDKAATYSEYFGEIIVDLGAEVTEQDGKIYVPFTMFLNLFDSFYSIDERNIVYLYPCQTTVMDILHMTGLEEYYFSVMEDSALSELEIATIAGYDKFYEKIKALFQGTVNLDWEKIQKALPKDTSHISEMLAKVLYTNSSEELDQFTDIAMLHTDTLASSGIIKDFLIENIEDGMEEELGEVIRKWEEVGDEKIKSFGFTSIDHCQEFLEEAREDIAETERVKAEINTSCKALDLYGSLVDVGFSAFVQYVTLANEIECSQNFYTESMQAFINGYQKMQDPLTEIQIIDELGEKADLYEENETNILKNPELSKEIIADIGNSLLSISLEEGVEKGIDELIKLYPKSSLKKFSSTTMLQLKAVSVGWDVAEFYVNEWTHGKMDALSALHAALYADILSGDALTVLSNFKIDSYDDLEQYRKLEWVRLRCNYMTRQFMLLTYQPYQTKYPEEYKTVAEPIKVGNKELERLMAVLAVGPIGATQENLDSALEVRGEMDAALSTCILDNPINYTEEAIAAYNDFISQGAYNQYTQNWESIAEKYGVLDINSDGIPELFINSTNMSAGWFNTLIFTYKVDASEIVFVSDEYNYAGIRYSTKYNAILYTDIKPSTMCGSEGFYELEGNDLIFKFSVGHDTDENGSYCFYFDGTTSSNITEDNRKEYFKDLVEIEYSELPNSPQINSKTEVELLSIMQSKIGCEVEDYIYIDMNHDGANELIATYCKEGYYQTWYCSSDGEICELVHENDRLMEYAEIEVLNVESETHIVVNAYMSMGTNKNYSIFALRDKKIVSVVSNQYGTVYITDNGDIALSVEAYDGFYDPSVDGLMVHTWKNTYIFFDGTTYKEYGATELSEEDYLGFQNASVIRETIDSEMREADTTLLEYKYFKRSNGIMHIQCNVHSDSGEIQYGYYTIRYSKNILEDEIGEYNQGQMETNFSNLEVIY